MSFKTTFRRVSAVLLILVSAISGSPVVAQEERTQFYESGDWRVEYELITCFLINEREDTGATLKIVHMRNANLGMVILLDSKPEGADALKEATFQIDSYSEPASVSFNKQNFGSMDKIEPLMRSFLRGTQLDLFAGGRSIAKFSLAGSAAAYRELLRCADQLYDGPVVPRAYNRPPAPPPALVLKSPLPEMREPDLSGPFQANRPVTPIVPGRWVSNNDYPTDAIDAEREGEVRFQVVVNPNGKVSTCHIIKSSGHADLDELTCRLVVERARFEPATDEEAKLTSTIWTSSLHWRVPQ